MTNTIKVICVDDLQDQCDLVHRAVNHSLGMRCIKSFSDAQALLTHLADIEAHRGGGVGRRKRDELIVDDQWPDVIVVDWMMPGVNGQLALELINHRWPFIKLIVYSALESDEILDLARAAGAAGVVQKSDGILHLLATIRRIAGEPAMSA